MNRGQVGGAGGTGEDPVVRALTHILEKAALVNYKQVYTQLEGIHAPQVVSYVDNFFSLSLSPSPSLSVLPSLPPVEDEDNPLSMAKMFDLVQYCIDFMYELHDFYWDDFNQVAQESHMAHVFTSHINAFWAFFLVDLREAMRIEDDVIKKLQLFHIVNQYFSSQRECSNYPHS